MREGFNLLVYKFFTTTKSVYANFALKPDLRCIPRVDVLSIKFYFVYAWFNDEAKGLKLSNE